MAKSNENLSLKKEVVIHGVTIKKMPNGAYFRALQTLKELPENFIKELNLSEDTKLSDLLDTKNIMNLLIKFLAVLPEFTLNFLSELMEIDYDVLENELSPIETVEIFKKFWEINKLNDFFELMKPMLTKLFQKIPATGFNEQLQSVSK